ncbi:MAG: DUF58 domain-containing protein [Gemmatimonadaceae bacterium]
MSRGAVVSRGGYGAIIDALRGVTWPARRPSRGATSGTHRSRLTGVSSEFTQYRPYRQGDDPRRLDWKLLARTDRAYMRITSDRAIMETVLIVDASASMAFPERTNEKWVQACRVSVGLAAVAHASGDPVGLLVPGATRTVQLPARTRRGIVAELARTLDGIEPAGGALLTPALQVVRRTARVVIVSDLLGDGDDLLRSARELAIEGEVYAVHIVARAELNPTGPAIMATDPEHPEIKRPLVLATRDEYIRAFAEWRAETARAWRAAGAVYTEVVTDEPAAHAIRRITRAPDPRPQTPGPLSQVST